MAERKMKIIICTLVLAILLTGRTDIRADDSGMAVKVSGAQSASAWSAHYNPASTLPRWIYAKQLRLLQAHWHNNFPPKSPPSVAHTFWKKISDAGFNSVCNIYWRGDDTDPGRTKDIRADAKAATRAGLQLIPVLCPFWYAERAAARKAGVPASVNGAGRTSFEITRKIETGIPCFVRRKYWDVVLATPMLAIAKLSLEPGVVIAGIDWDPELYGTDYTFGPWPVLGDKESTSCLCDDCFNDYITDRKIPIDRLRAPKKDELDEFLAGKDDDERATADEPSAILQGLDPRKPPVVRHGAASIILPEKRFDWLTTERLLDDYGLHLYETVYAIWSGIYREVRKINPNLILSAYPGAYGYDKTKNWFLTAMYDAMRDSPPCLARAATYKKWATGRLRDHAPLYRDHLRNMPVVHGPFLATWNGEQANLVECCQLFTAGNPGYWAYIQSRLTDVFLARFERLNRRLDSAMQSIGGELYPGTTEQNAMVSYKALPWVVLSVSTNIKPAIDLQPAEGIRINDDLTISDTNVAHIAISGPGEDVAGRKVVGTLPSPLAAYSYCVVRQAPRGLVAQVANTESFPIWGRLTFAGLPGSRYRVTDAMSGVLFHSSAGKDVWTPKDISKGLLIRVADQNARWVFVEPLPPGNMPAVHAGLEVQTVDATLREFNAVNTHWREMGLKKLLAFMYPPRVRNLLRDVSADPMDETARMPAANEVNFENETSSLSQWAVTGDIKLEIGDAADGDRSVQLCSAHGKPPASIRQPCIELDYGKDEPVTLTFRAALRSRAGGTVAARVLAANGKPLLGAGARITVRPSAAYLPYEAQLQGRWPGDVSDTTFELSAATGTVSCDLLVLIEGSPDKPVPVRSRATLVNPEGAGKFSFLYCRQIAGTFKADEIKCELGTKACPLEAGKGKEQIFEEWLSDRYVVPFHNHKYRPEFGTFSFWTIAKTRVPGKREPIIEQKSEPDGTFTIEERPTRVDNPLTVKLVPAEDYSDDVLSTKTRLGFLFERRAGYNGPFPDVVFEMPDTTRVDGTSHAQALALTETEQVLLPAERSAWVKLHGDQRERIIALMRATQIKDVKGVVFFLIPPHSGKVNPFSWFIITPDGKTGMRHHYFLHRAKKTPAGSTRLVNQFSLSKDKERGEQEKEDFGPRDDLDMALDELDVEIEGNVSTKHRRTH